MIEGEDFLSFVYFYLQNNWTRSDGDRQLVCCVILVILWSVSNLRPSRWFQKSKILIDLI